MEGNGDGETLHSAGVAVGFHLDSPTCPCWVPSSRCSPLLVPPPCDLGPDSHLVPEPVPDSLPSFLHPNFHQTSLPRHPPFRPSDKTILSSFPRSVFLLPSRDHPAIGRHCSSSKSSVPLQSWNSISISELQCLSLSAPPPRSLTSAHCHPFPASQLPPFHISKPTPSDRLQRN